MHWTATRHHCVPPTKAAPEETGTTPRDASPEPSLRVQAMTMGTAHTMRNPMKGRIFAPLQRLSPVESSPCAGSNSLDGPKPYGLHAKITNVRGSLGNEALSAIGHVWTAPSWQELSSRLQPWSVQPCVRPVRAARKAAAHNALRGSGPGQYHAFDKALAQSGLS
jgi:hypothetical protein